MTLVRPTLMPMPFRGAAGPNAGLLSSIPLASAAPGASLADGFPIATMTMATAGGVPPKGADMNGILNWITTFQTWVNAGGQFPFDATLAAAIGGYPLGAVLQLNSGLASVICTTAGNTTDPNVSMTGWSYYNTASKSHAASVGYPSALIINALDNWMAGVAPLGSVITPNATGNIMVVADGFILVNPGLNSPLKISIRYGTGAAPANGSAATGSIAKTITINAPVSGMQVGFCLQALITGLTVGTPYWIDLGANSFIAGAAVMAMANSSISAFEV